MTPHLLTIIGVAVAILVPPIACFCASWRAAAKQQREAARVQALQTSEAQMQRIDARIMRLIDELSDTGPDERIVYGPATAKILRAREYRERAAARLNVHASTNTGT